MIETASLVSAYVASLESRRIPFNTLKAYRSDLQHFVATMPGDLGTITVPEIESYLSAGGVGVATSRRRHACLRSFYHWLMIHAYLDASPMDRLVMGKTPEREPRPLPEDQVALVLAAIPTSKTRDRALFTLLYETGMRVSEALGIQYADLDLTMDDEKVRVLGKGGRERTVLLTAAPLSIRLLRRHLKTIRSHPGLCFAGMSATAAAICPWTTALLITPGRSIVRLQGSRRRSINFATAGPPCLSKRASRSRPYVNCWAIAISRVASFMPTLTRKR